MAEKVLVEFEALVKILIEEDELDDKNFFQMLLHVNLKIENLSTRMAICFLPLIH